MEKYPCWTREPEVQVGIEMFVELGESGVMTEVRLLKMCTVENYATYFNTPFDFCTSIEFSTVLHSHIKLLPKLYFQPKEAKVPEVGSLSVVSGAEY